MAGRRFVGTLLYMENTSQRSAPVIKTVLFPCFVCGEETRGPEAKSNYRKAMTWSKAEGTKAAKITGPILEWSHASCFEQLASGRVDPGQGRLL